MSARYTYTIVGNYSILLYFNVIVMIQMGVLKMVMFASIMEATMTTITTITTTITTTTTTTTTTMTTTSTMTTTVVV